MRFYPHSAHSRRAGIRLWTYALFMAAALFTCICMQTHLKQTSAAAQNRLRRSILAHMNEESEALRHAIRQQDSTAIDHHADTLCGYASLFETLPAVGDEKPILSALADSAQFYSALANAAQREPGATDPAFWESAADTVSLHITSIALSMSERLDPTQPTTTETDAAASLSAFTASFRADPLRITTSVPGGFRFDREPMVSSAEARQILKGLIGSTASFLEYTVTDDDHGCYIFSCQNGYAEISRCGGHLLSYAFYPRGNTNVRAVTVCDTDLLSAAVAFLKKAGLPSDRLSVQEDCHGIRIFHALAADDRSVTVGVRMHDGAVVSCQAENYYRLPVSSQ